MPLDMRYDLFDIGEKVDLSTLKLVITSSGSPTTCPFTSTQACALIPSDILFAPIFIWALMPRRCSIQCKVRDFSRQAIGNICKWAAQATNRYKCCIKSKDVEIAAFLLESKNRDSDKASKLFQRNASQNPSTLPHASSRISQSNIESWEASRNLCFNDFNKAILQQIGQKF